MLAHSIARLPQRGRHLIKTVALAGALMSTMAFGGTAVASAAHISSNSGSANVRTCGAVSPNCRVVATLYNGRGVNMTAWCDSSWVYPPQSNYPSPRWFKINSPVSGWVHSSLVANQQRVGLNCYA